MYIFRILLIPLGTTKIRTKTKNLKNNTGDIFLQIWFLKTILLYLMEKGGVDRQN